MSRWLPVAGRAAAGAVRRDQPGAGRTRRASPTSTGSASARRAAAIRAKALVTGRLRPFTIDGKAVHHVGHAVALGLQGHRHRRRRQRPDVAGRRPERDDPRRQGVRVQRREGVRPDRACNLDSALEASSSLRPHSRRRRLRRSAAPTGTAHRAPAAGGVPPRQPMGFYHRHDLCIGCKACEVACKEWNQLPAIDGGANTLSGDSYDNTRPARRRATGATSSSSSSSTPTGPRRRRWLMMSDVCKHCVQAGCLEVCPTGAIIRTEFDTVFIQADVCNGCRDCIAACPFGVIEINQATNTAQKCTLCYDRLQAGLTPACAKACPTAIDPVRADPRAAQRADARASRQLHRARDDAAYLYGGRRKILGGLNAFYLLMDKPESLRPARTRSCPVATSGRARCSDRRRSGRRAARDSSLRRTVIAGRPAAPDARPDRTTSRRGIARCRPTPSSPRHPEWHWMVILYFFFGGHRRRELRAGRPDLTCSAPARRPAAGAARSTSRSRPCCCAAPLLIVDLTRPERFWHMLIQSETGLPMFKSWSPMSVGAWALMLFGLFAFLSFLAALARGRRPAVRGPCARCGGCRRWVSWAGRPLRLLPGRLHRRAARVTTGRSGPTRACSACCSCLGRVHAPRR